MQFSTIVKILSKDSFDSVREAHFSDLIVDVSPDYKLSFSDIHSVLRLMSFDSGKINILKCIFSTKLVTTKITFRIPESSSHVASTLSLFSFDSGRLEALELIMQWFGFFTPAYIVVDDFVSILNAFSYASNKGLALKVLLDVTQHLPLTIAQAYEFFTRLDNDNEVLLRIVSRISASSASTVSTLTFNSPHTSVYQNMEFLHAVKDKLPASTYDEALKSLSDKVQEMKEMAAKTVAASGSSGGKWSVESEEFISQARWSMTAMGGGFTVSLVKGSPISSSVMATGMGICVSLNSISIRIYKPSSVPPPFIHRSYSATASAQVTVIDIDGMRVDSDGILEWKIFDNALYIKVVGNSFYKINRSASGPFSFAC